MAELKVWDHSDEESDEYRGVCRVRTRIPLSYWLQTQLFNFWGSYKVVGSESFNFYFPWVWASEL